MKEGEQTPWYVTDNAIFMQSVWRQLLSRIQVLASTPRGGQAEGDPNWNAPRDVCAFCDALPLYCTK